MKILLIFELHVLPSKDLKELKSANYSLIIKEHVWMVSVGGILLYWIVIISDAFMCKQHFNVGFGGRSDKLYNEG